MAVLARLDGEAVALTPADIDGHVAATRVGPQWRTSQRARLSALNLGDERDAPVQPACLFMRVVVLGVRLAPADRDQLTGWHARAHQIVLHGIRAAFPEGKVIRSRAETAGVALDRHNERRVLFEGGHSHAESL